MGWDLDGIKAKIRKLTGKRSTNQLSDADLLTAINNFYQWDFPVELEMPEFDDWYEFDTADGVGYQDLPETVVSVEPPVYVDSERISFYTDEEDFFSQYPWDQTGADYEDEPEAVHLKGRRLYLRPVPDDAYTVKIKSRTTKPTALSSGTDEPVYEGAGPMIAYGVSMILASEDGDTELQGDLSIIYKYYKGLVSKRSTLHIAPGTRSKPRF